MSSLKSRKTTFVSQHSSPSQNVSSFGVSTNTLAKQTSKPSVFEIYFFVFYVSCVRVTPQHSKSRPIREDLRDARNKGDELEVFLIFYFKRIIFSSLH
jgi:hypothetical protein